MDSIRVLVADESRLTVLGLQTIFDRAQGIDIVAVARDEEEVLEQLEQMHVDIVVMEITLMKINGLRTAMRIRQKYPDVKILVLSLCRQEDLILKICRAGATGFVLKSSGDEEIIQGIRAVASGERYFSEEIGKLMLDSLTGSKAQERPGSNVTIQLTKRELEILSLIAQECTAPEIAQKLFISPYTVETHRKNLLQKLGVKNMVGLVKYAIHNGLVQL